jgi:hypothetical protein
MTQWIGIAVVIGAAAGQIVASFRRWDSQRVADADDPTLVEPSQWPGVCRREMALFVGALRDNAAEPPIVFYREYVDSWSSFDVVLDNFRGKDCRESIEVCFESSQLVCYPLPDSGALAGSLKAAKRRRSYRDLDKERRWFADSLLDACEACGWLAGEAAIIVTRRVVAPTVLDEEIIAAMQRIPDWLAGPNGRLD